MSTEIHVDFESIGAVSSSLHALTSGSADTSGFDLSAMRSDLVTSAGASFSDGWSNALEIFTLTSTGLAGGLDATLRDFLASEQASMESIATSIGALDQ